VAAQPRGDGRLGQAVVAVQRPDQPPLLELGELAAVVQRDQKDLRLGPVDVRDAGSERAKAQRTRGAHALEAIEDLELTLLGEHAQRLELAVPRERSAHGLERRSLAQPQRREAVAELGEVNITLLVTGGLHAADESIREVCAAMVMRDALPDPGQISLRNQVLGRRSWRVTRSRSLPDFRTNEAKFGSDRAARWRVTPRRRDPQIG
jgi:hypothetical protein